MKFLITLLIVTGLNAIDYDFKEYLQKKLYKEEITALQTFDLKNQGFIIIDVRSKKEYDYSHIPGALWIPVYFDKFGKRVFNKSFVEQVQNVLEKKDRETILISKRDDRSRFAANILAEEGFSNIYIVLDGFSGKNGWIRSGLQYWKDDKYR